MVQKDKADRRHDLDGLRALAVLLLVPFHTALMFSLDPNDIVYVKNNLESPLLKQLAYFVHQWHMPLLFTIAGASAWYGLQSRSAWQYLRKRLLRLAVPLVFGVTVLVPVLVYCHLVTGPGCDSYRSVYQRFFRIDPSNLSGRSGTFTPAHLWFILFLLVYTFAALPLFAYLNRRNGRRSAAQLTAFIERRGAIFLLAVPLAAAAAAPDLGGKPPLLYFAYYVLGYILTRDDRFQRVLERHALSGLLCGVIARIVTVAVGRPFAPYSLGDVVMHCVYHFGAWCWVIAILGFGSRYLNRASGPLRYANRASYPFYILHLPVNTVVGYFILQWDAGITVKYLAIAAATLLATIGVYDVFVKRTAITRFLFGMKVWARKAPRGHETASREPSASEKP